MDLYACMLYVEVEWEERSNRCKKCARRSTFLQSHHNKTCVIMVECEVYPLSLLSPPSPFSLLFDSRCFPLMVTPFSFSRVSYIRVNYGISRSRNPHSQSHAVPNCSLFAAPPGSDLPQFESKQEINRSIRRNGRLVDILNYGWWKVRKRSLKLNEGEFISDVSGSLIEWKNSDEEMKSGKLNVYFESLVPIQEIDESFPIDYGSFLFFFSSLLFSKWHSSIRLATNLFSISRLLLNDFRRREEKGNIGKEEWEGEEMFHNKNE